MFNSIFKKQFVLYMGIILIIFVMLGVALSQAFKSYFIDQKKESLSKQGEKISNLYSERYAKAMNGGFIDMIAIGQIANEINNQYQIISEYLDSSFFVVNTAYQIEMASSDIQQYIGYTIDMKAFATVMSGEIVTAQGAMLELYDVPMFTVCYPIIVSDSLVIGALFMNSSLSEFQSTISKAYKLGIICLLISACLAFIMIFISSKTMSKPLREMNNAAKVIANGDFDKRIIPKGHDEVGQLAESLNNMAESLSQQETTRKEFIANISHDFRSPLTSMRGFLQAIEDGTIPPEKHSRYINIVLEETERLSKLANDILELNNIQTMNIALAMENFDINDLIRKTINHFEQRLLDKKLIINVTFSDDVTYVHADYEKISRVFYNLIDNAIKFTQEGGKIDIETTIDANKIRVAVKDNGPGISSEEKKHVFERFYKADSSRGQDKLGSGLGLSIVKEFIKAHGENISLNSEPGLGCEFVFTLQLAND